MRSIVVLLLSACLTQGAWAQFFFTGPGFLPDENGTNLDNPGGTQAEGERLQAANKLKNAPIAPEVKQNAPGVLPMNSGQQLATDRRSPSEIKSDREIEAKAGLRIRENFGDSVHVNVSSYAGTAIVTGEVPDKLRGTQVQDVVLKIDGVFKSLNELVVMENSSVSSRLRDAKIASDIRSALTETKGLFANAFKINVERGVAYIQGRATEKEIAAMTEVVSLIYGVKGVVRAVDKIIRD